MKFIIPFLTLATASASSSVDVDLKQSAQLAHLKNQHFKAMREAASNENQRRAANALRNFKPSFMKEENTTECNWFTEETCPDGSCATWESGGCPCLDGQEKCTPAPELEWLTFCTEPELCCVVGEELCFDPVSGNATGCAVIADGGCPCPEGQEKCGALPEWNIPGYCTDVCCTLDEETCYDESWNATGCAAYSEGGCPCPEGEEKCGALGFCTSVCCGEGEETCYDDDWNPTECQAIADGGCPCPDDQVKCYDVPEWNFSGFCVDICCTLEQEYCVDESGQESCADISAGGCPCPDGEEKCNPIPELGFSGYCVEPENCCVLGEEEQCYEIDENWNITLNGCAAILDGGCPCPEGEEKCGAIPELNYTGYCTSLCCEEATCFTDWEPTSCATFEEGCPMGTSFDVLKGESMAVMGRNMMKSELAKLQGIQSKKATMLEGAHDIHHKSIEKMMEAEELMVLRKAKANMVSKSFGQDLPAFMKVF